MTRHLLEYWQGSKTLFLTFTIFLLLPSLAILLLRQGLLTQIPGSESGLLTTTAYLLLVVYAIASVVTLVGINRKIRILDGGYGTNTNVAICNVLSLVLIVYTTTNILDLVTAGATPQINKQEAKTLSPGFSQQTNKPGVLVVQGDIGIAATKRLATILEKNSGIKKLILHSEGGNVFEARGMARLVTEYNLHTHVDDQCFSACTLVFVSGAQRTAGHNAEFGFHSYRLQTEYGGVGIDINEQQKIDASIFAGAGVSEEFIDGMYQAQYRDMWFPELKRLMDAGFITRMIAQTDP